MQFNGNDIMNEHDQLSSIDKLDLDVRPDASTSTFHGMCIFNSIDNCQSIKSFFLVKGNGQKNFLHKQTANWYFSKK